MRRKGNIISEEQPERFMMHGNLTAIRADLAAKKAASNRGERERERDGHPPQEGWVGQVEDSG